ncbi:MAG: TIGR01777 family protein [Acidimicrobiaceae bacterium]|nr:TIGR01777 family protein [Acidimicrobiaceae bacterium]MYH42204.1 TIGR01777 family protein [Acidimicrobiaceae bacterium]MYJ41579.1 TIGR01777 family protein [Acidimicrobiaceae bacterium]MYJ80939.1 TIGR01777 family protein [Acidimicrobiaceae bacterium]MYK75078.1 TIGR01777 family protein [Acidimicrobiaceae bacterium]
MRVAVTGSTGLIGRALVERLASDGHQTVRVVRSPGGPGRQGSTVNWDPGAGQIESEALEGLDAVVHLAGEPIAARRWSDEQKQRIATSRRQGTALLAGALARLDQPPGVLVSASAIGYYGDRGDERLDESSSGGSDFLARVCRDWEAAADPAREAGIRVTHPRTGVVLSRSGGALAEMLPFFRLGIGGRIGSGRQWMSWITLHDEVEALLWLLTADVEGPVNFTAPEPVTNRELTAALGRALRRPTLLPTPKPALWARLGRELTGALLYSSARVEPALLLRREFRFTHPDIATGIEAVLARA